MLVPKSIFHRIIAVSTLIVILCGVSLPASATTKNTSTNSSSTTTSNAAANNISSGVTQSYNADPSVQIGMVVKLKDKDSGTVVPLDNSDIQDMLGVVVPANNATIVLSPQTVTQQQVLVATSGHFNVLVSNQGGPIKVGDYITVSVIAGVGMKASAQQNEVLGKAAGNFTGAANVIGTVPLKSNVGTTTNVTIGRIPVDLNISHNPLFQKSADYVPAFLSKVAVAVASRPVSAARIYLSLALLITTSFITANMLYSGIRSGMIAVGRNPLSKKSIIRSLIQTVIAGLIIFVVGVFAVYLLLKL